jgi:hypothetical protein
MTARWLLLATFALSLYSAGQVWLVQLSSYPLWAYVGRNEFSAYHRAWWRSIWGVVLGPAALVTLGSVLMLWRAVPEVPAWALWASVGLQACFVLGTAVWWGPLMARLEGADAGLDQRRYRLLMSTHWLRVLVVTAYAVLLGWMMAIALRLVAAP